MPGSVLEDHGDALRIGRPDARVDRSIGEDFDADPAAPLHGGRHGCRMAFLSHRPREKDHPPTGSEAD